MTTYFVLEPTATAATPVMVNGDGISGLNEPTFPTRTITHKSGSERKGGIFQRENAKHREASIDFIRRMNLNVAHRFSSLRPRRARR